MSLRQVLLLTVLFLAGLPVAAQAQLPVPAPTLTTPTLTAPTLTTPTLTTPTLPAPLPPPPTLPAPPAPTPPPPTPTVTTPTVTTPTVTTAPSLPGPAPAPAPTPTPSPGVPTPGAPAPAPAEPTVPITGTATLVSPGTSGANASPPEPRAGERSRDPSRGRRPSITFGFRIAAPGRVRIPLTQVAPVCRDAGLLVLRAVRGANRVRYDGRAGSRPLPDGTYVAETPSGDVRFAIVRGKPTRKREAFAPSVCAQPGFLLDGMRSLIGAGASSAPPPPPPAAESGGDRDDAAGAGLDALPRVLGTSVAEAAEAATSLHPAFYVLLALAIAALATATLPAHTLPATAAGAALARRRAELTVGGTLALLTVIVAYWLALL